MGGIKIRRAVLLILAVVFMAMVVKPAPADDDISEAVLNQAKDKLIAELDRRGYPRVAQFFGQMDPKKWGQYAGRLSAGEYGAVINDILNEQKDAIMTDLYERGKAYAAQNELLGGNTMTYIGYAEKHGGALLAMADEAWEGNYGRAGDILFEHVKAEIKSQVEGRLKKFTLEMIEAGMNEALGHVITNAGGIFLKIIELEIMAIEAFEEWSKYYFSTFQVKKPDGSVEHRELCTQYEYNRKEMGWSPDDAMRLNPSGEKGAPVPIEDMIVLGGYFYGADNMDRDQVMNVLEACYIGRHTSKSKMQEAISRGKKRADRMIFEEIRTGMKQGEETLITILDGIDFPKDVNINITVKDNETREVIPGATVKFGSNSKTASSGTATFRASLAELQANGGLNQFEVYAEAEGYEPHTGNISGSTLTSRINKETFTIDIPIAISKKKGPKPTALAINPPSVELTIGESQTFTALLALDDGSSRDVTNDPNIVWTGGTLQNSFEATVEGSFTISASYTEPESGSSITGTAQIQVKAPEPPPVPDCPPREHWDPMLKKCVCDSGYVWDELTKQCIEKKKERQRQDRPGIRLTKAASAAEVPVDSSVVYTLTVSNAGNVPLTGIRLSDNVCPNLQFVSGDGNGNGVLDTLEVWTYKGAQILSQPGPVVNTATVTGIGPGGAAVTDAAAVTVTVIRGLVTVPDLYDLLEATAEYDIREAGLTVGTVQNESSDVVSPGRVTRQTPAAGTKVPAKTAVSFWVSKSDPKFIYLDPPRSTITVDSTVAFTATLIYEDGAEEVLNPAQVQWTPGPGNSFRGTTIGTFIITAVYRDAQGAATVAVVADDDDSDLWGWGDPISHADDTLAVGLQPTPDMYEWYALCKKGVGEVYYGKDRDPTRFFVMAGPFPGPRSVKKWIDDNCPRWRCTLEGACADDPAHGGPWKVLCNKTDGSVVLGKES
ncbi:MAG: PASTA domain-containing protein, partial [Candidatus Eisenbacteria bacterium]|nr:PASTA domain-containing protein [Candidatus Eisenbacteria bacterium]